MYNRYKRDRNQNNMYMYDYIKQNLISELENVSV